MKITTTENTSRIHSHKLQGMAANPEPTEEGKFQAYLAQVNQFVADPQNSVGVAFNTNNVGIGYGSEHWDFHRRVRNQIELARYGRGIHGPLEYNGVHPAQVAPGDLIRRTKFDQSEETLIANLAKDNPSTVCGPIELSQDDTKCLDDREELADNVIDAYLALCYLRSRPSDVFITTLEISAHLPNRTGVEARRTGGADAFDYVARGTFAFRPDFKRVRVGYNALAPSIFDQRMLLYPMNVNGNHWVMVYVDLALKTMTLLNSMHGGETGPVEVPGEPDTDLPRDPIVRRFHFLRRILHLEHIQMYGVAMPFGGWRYIQLGGKSISTQGNPYDCGVYVCLFGNRLLSWLERAGTEDPVPEGLFAGIKTSDIPTVRRQMRLDLNRQVIYPDEVKVYELEEKEEEEE